MIQDDKNWMLMVKSWSIEGILLRYLFGKVGWLVALKNQISAMLLEPKLDLVHSEYTQFPLIRNAAKSQLVAFLNIYSFLYRLCFLIFCFFTVSVS